MKKYWRPGVLLVLILLTIGTYYVQAANSTSKLPQYYIKKISGNENEIKDLVINGFYSANQRLEVSKNGTDYGNDRSLVEQIMGAGYFDSTIKELQQKYRNFMRGKRMEDSLYEDDRLLAYAGVKDQHDENSGGRVYTFNIDVLNKKSENKITFESQLKDSHRYYMVSVQDVQYIDRELKVLTSNYMNGNSSDEEFHVYTFDIPAKKLIGDQTLFSNEKAPADMKLHHQIVNSENHIKPNKYIVFKNYLTKKTEEDIPSGKSSFSFYDYMDDSTGELNIPKDVLENQSNEIEPYYEESDIYLGQILKDQLKISAVNLSNGKLDNEVVLPHKNGEGDSIQTWSIFAGGKSYLLFKQGNDLGGETPVYDLYAADLDTQSIVYHGELKEKGNKDSRLKQLELYGLKIK
ncbi:hypothetical protein [Peribacillus kribbensis]|uniref:hypothetical protein n=1 Tax=Peribacillus kribbensis TaxID=356658 RepID=UPI000427ED15|nr:hypothetical protein [Peribacillus kribbensis]